MVHKPPSSPPRQLTRAEIIANLEATRLAQRAKRAAMARTDPCIFAMHVMRDEETRGEIDLAPMHREWHQMIDTAKTRRVLLFAAKELGKTNQIVGRLLYELGRNPNLRCLVLSNTYQQAVKIVRAVARYIESSEALREVADGVTFHKLESGTPWTDASITVKRPGKTIKEPSVQAVGVHGSFLGSRFDLVIVDDILDYENTHTPRARDDLYDWYSATVEGCLTRNARTICIGNVWNIDDAMHRWERTGTWESKRFPVLNEKGESVWPERWSLERIEERRHILGPREFSRQMMCVASEDDDAHFTREMFRLPLARGNGVCPATRFEDPLPEGYRAYTGVDLAVSQRSTADRTAIFTILVNPVGEKLVLECQSGRWLAREIIDRIIDVHERFQSVVAVENNNAQDYLLQVLRDRAPNVPVRAFTTGTNKHHPVFGIEAMSVELDRGQWIIPNMGGLDHPRLAGELNAWVSEVLSFRPMGHAGDRLIASWICRECARQDRMRARPARVSVRLIGGPRPPSPEPAAETRDAPILIPTRW